jgi:hypothetical protein
MKLIVLVKKRHGLTLFKPYIVEAQGASSLIPQPAVGPSLDLRVPANLGELAGRDGGRGQLPLRYPEMQA